MPQQSPRPPVTLHLGAHRTGTTSLQRLLDRNVAHLNRRGVAIWGPRRTRTGLLAGVMGDPARFSGGDDPHLHRAAGRIAISRADLSASGIGRLVISDENLLGGLRENLLLAQPYPTAGARLRRLDRAVPGIDRVVLAIRAPDAWWASVFAFLITRGFAPPDRMTVDAIVAAHYGWRQVILDVADAMPRARLTVWTFEDMAVDPARAFADLTGHKPCGKSVPHLNASPPLAVLQSRLRDDGCLMTLPQMAGHYSPFTTRDRAALRARYQDDLAWLRDGADGRITLGPEAPPQGPFRDRRRRDGQGRRPQQMDPTG
ncbi:hypothetical protein [Jannaschia rubra]|uniref:hypothetical protein n=1 Tax=Jannaschia rubra TaxID=282197 RepID=UPI00248F93AF|nr:hypothetical protein [Jannaschia rubra]